MSHFAAGALISDQYQWREDCEMGKKPNILIMWGDDIGQSNLSILTKGMMGYRTCCIAMPTARRGGKWPPPASLRAMVAGIG
jgi:hypothetical protein